jgi:hypothetical protein
MTTESIIRQARQLARECNAAERKAQARRLHVNSEITRIFGSH